jgi:hypothetical protein
LQARHVQYLSVLLSLSLLLYLNLFRAARHQVDAVVLTTTSI